jgi:hypothetical protein
VPPDAAARCSAAIASMTGFQLVFVNKPITTPKWEASELKLYEKDSREVVKRIFSSYKQIKDEFEKTHFELENPSCYAQVRLDSWSSSCDTLYL